MTFNKVQFFAMSFLVAGVVACGSKVDKNKTTTRGNAPQAKLQKEKAEENVKIILNGVIAEDSMGYPGSQDGIKTSEAPKASLTLSNEKKEYLNGLGSLKSLLVLGCSDEQLATLPVEAGLVRLAEPTVPTDGIFHGVRVNTIAVCGAQNIDASIISLPADKVVFSNASIKLNAKTPVDKVIIAANTLVVNGESTIEVTEADAKMTSPNGRIELTVANKMELKDQSSILNLKVTAGKAEQKAQEKTTADKK